MDVSMRSSCVRVALCVGSGLAKGWSPIQGLLPTVYRVRKTQAVLPIVFRISKLKRRPRPNRRSVEPNKEEEWYEITKSTSLLWGRGLILDFPNLEGQVLVFISPRNRVPQLYSRALGSLFVAPCGGGTLTSLHSGTINLSVSQSHFTADSQSVSQSVWTSHLVDYSALKE
jgi:hypothetical protein